MNILRITIQNIKSKPHYTLLSILVLSLSITLLLGVQQLKTSFEYQMENNLGNVDLVIGAKGSPLQLVLSSVLHVDNPTGNIPYNEAYKIGQNPMIKYAVPISYGDNYKGYRIVGTTPTFLKFYNAELQKGNIFQKSMDVIIGHHIAEKLQLKVGDTFLSSHGLIESTVDVHDDVLTIVGILKPTQKVIDHLIITNLESIWDAHDHDNHKNDKEHKQNEHKIDYNNKEITSLLITFRNPTAYLTLPRSINKSTNMQAALPKYELDRLYNFTGIGFNTITWIAYLILIISGLTIFISAYKMVKERAFDLALMRTYGASNTKLIKMVLYEGLSIAVFAFIMAFIVTKIILLVIGNSIQQIILQDLPIVQVFAIFALVLSMVVFSVLFAIIPIFKMSISKVLSNEK